VDLLGHRAFTVVAEEVLVQQFAQVKLGLVLAPAAELLHELRIDVGEGLWLFSYELAQPLDGGCFIGDEHGHLLEFARGHFLAVVIQPPDLAGKHAVALDETLRQPNLELLAGDRHGVALADVVSHHLVEQDARITFRDKLQQGSLLLRDRQILQVRADKIPHAFFGLCLLLKALFKTAIGFVC